MAISEISAEAFQNLVKSNPNIKILDVRTGIECRAEAIDYPYTHIPLHLLDAASFIRDNGKDGTLYILCRSGGRARKAAESLMKAGLADVWVVTGGLGACKACGTSVTTGKVISLERQVRIAAGMLVLGGVLMGHFMDADFYILSGAIGAGLIFAGVTDKCGMALLLARAPWNTDRRQDEINKSIAQFNEKGA